MLFDNACIQDYFTVEVVTDEIGVIFFSVFYFYQIIFYIECSLYKFCIYNIFKESCTCVLYDIKLVNQTK